MAMCRKFYAMQFGVRLTLSVRFSFANERASKFALKLVSTKAKLYTCGHFMKARGGQFQIQQPNVIL